MAMHLAGWYQSVDPAGVGVSLDAMLDERIFTTGKNIRVPRLNQIVGAGAFLTSAASTLANAYIYSPTLNLLGNSWLNPVNTGSTTPYITKDVLHWVDMFDFPLSLGYDELVRAYATSNPAAAGIQAVFALFSDGTYMNIPAGDSITWEGTFPAPTSTGTWAQVEPVWKSELPPGEYAIIGMKAVASTTLAVRVNTRQGEQWRPGVLATLNNNIEVAPYQRRGKHGVWAVFPYTQLPTLEVCAGTAAAGSVYLDIVRMSSRTQ